MEPAEEGSRGRATESALTATAREPMLSSSPAGSSTWKQPASLPARGLAVGWAAFTAFLFASIATVYMARFVGDQRNRLPVDGVWYQAMAAGQNVIRPFANRVLGPLCAHVLGRFANSSDDMGFFILGLSSIWVAVFGILLPVLQRRQALGFTSTLFFLYFWRDNFENYFLPDLFHIALLVLFFSFLRMRWWLPAALMFVPLYLARESTLLLSLIAIPILWRLLGRRTGLLFLASSGAAIAASKFASRHGLPNIYGINDTLYMIAKIPWNFSKNVLGITLWTNTGPIAPPAHVWTLPPSVHLGAIHQFGFSAPASVAPLVTTHALLLLFGLGPCAVLCLLYRIPLSRLLPRSEPYLWVAAIYGSVSYVLAPALGSALFRLVSYAWPLFLVYLPTIMPRIWPKWLPWQTACLLAAHLLPYWLVIHGKLVGDWSQVAGVCVADAVGCVLLLRAPVAAAPAFEAVDQTA